MDSKSRSEKTRKSNFGNPKPKKQKQNDTTPPTTPSRMSNNCFNVNFGNDSHGQTFAPNNNYSNTGNKDTNKNNKHKNNQNDNHNHNNHNNNNNNNNNDHDRTIPHEHEHNEIKNEPQNETQNHKEEKEKEEEDVKEIKQVEAKNYQIRTRFLDNIYILLQNMIMMNDINDENNNNNDDNDAPISPILVCLQDDYSENIFVKSGVVEKEFAEKLYAAFESVLLNIQKDLKRLANMHDEYMSGGYGNDMDNNNHNNINTLYCGDANLMTGSYIGNNNVDINTNNDIITITFEDCSCSWSSINIPSYALNYNVLQLFMPAGDCLQFDQKSMALYSVGDTIKDTFIIIATLALRKVKISFFDQKYN